MLDFNVTFVYVYKQSSNIFKLFTTLEKIYDAVCHDSLLTYIHRVIWYIGSLKRLTEFVMKQKHDSIVIQ